MQKDSLKKLSVLGLVIMGASAVAAAVIPSKDKSDSKDRLVGKFELSTGGTGGNTCVEGGNGLQCDFTNTGNGTGLSSTSATNASDDNSTTANVGGQTETSTTHLP